MVHRRYIADQSVPGVIIQGDPDISRVLAATPRIPWATRAKPSGHQ